MSNQEPRSESGRSKPAAWKFRNSPNAAWQYSDYPPAGVGPNGYVVALYEAAAPQPPIAAPQGIPPGFVQQIRAMKRSLEGAELLGYADECDRLLAMLGESKGESSGQAPGEAKHQWVEANDLVKWPHCLSCGIVKRADGKNKPCRGPSRIIPRASESATPRTDAHLSHLNLPDGRKIGLPDETVKLLRDLERKLAEAKTDLRLRAEDALRWREKHDALELAEAAAIADLKEQWEER